MTKQHLASYISLLALTVPALALDFQFSDDISAKLNGAMTVGTMIRTESPDSAIIGSLSAPRVGMAPGQLKGNAGNSDLNFEKDRPVSTVLKAFFDLELKRQNLGLFARAKAWYDYELSDGNHAYGNAANGFKKNTKLSDAGFEPEAKFSNVQLTDAYAFAVIDAGNASALDVRVGRQVINWGTARFLRGGINAISPSDFAAQNRPGALPEESKVPVGMLYTNYEHNKQWGVEGFLQYEFRPNVLAGCGTFSVTANYLSTGCNYVSVLQVIDDATAYATGRYPKRNPNINANGGGQYGVSVRYQPSGTDTEFRGYVMNYHNRAPNIRVTNPNIAGGYGDMTTTRLTNPNGLKFGLIYAENIRLYGASFSTQIDETAKVYGEAAYRPNQPLNQNAADLIAAFVGRAPTSALNIAKHVNAIAPGGAYDGYDRYKMTTASLGGEKVFADVIGAKRVTLSGEIGASHIDDLPDSGLLRYGRSDEYGVAAVNGVPCVDTSTAQKSCSKDGFVTSNAWGYRLRLSANYPNAFFGAVLTPSLLFASDVKGYTFDGTFLENRKMLTPGLRADWGKKFFADIQYNRITGGAYNQLIDRDTVTLVAGARF